MEVRKMLYATDTAHPEFIQIQRLLGLRTLGIEEVIFLQGVEINTWEASFEDFGIKAKVVSANGPLVSSIVATARQESVGLVAACFQRDRNRSIITSQTRALFRLSPVPVMALPENGKDSRIDETVFFSNVIFATDWSHSAEKAMAFLLSLKGIIQTLEIVHVIDKRLSVRDMRDLKRKSIRSRERFLDHGIDAEAHIYAGKRWREIVQAAHDYRGTCIVMGATDRFRLRRPISNSSSYRVMQASELPTLVIP